MALNGKNRPEEKKAISIRGPGKRALVAFSKRSRAVKALLRWQRALERGVALDIGEAARDHGLSKRQLLKILQEDQKLQDEIFGPLTMEAQAGLQKALIVASEELSNPDAKSGEKVKWAEFLARMVGGGYEKKQAQPIVIANLIPELPPAVQHLKARVIDQEPAEKLEDLL